LNAFLLHNARELAYGFVVLLGLQALCKRAHRLGLRLIFGREYGFGRRTMRKQALLRDLIARSRFFHLAQLGFLLRYLRAQVREFVLGISEWSERSLHRSKYTLRFCMNVRHRRIRKRRTLARPPFPNSK